MRRASRARVALRPFPPYHTRKLNFVVGYFARAPLFFAAFFAGDRFDAPRFVLPPGRRGSGFFLVFPALSASSVMVTLCQVRSETRRR